MTDATIDAADHAGRYHLDHETTIDALEAELTRTVALAERCPPELVIPTCPGWTAADLWEHLGTTHRWACEIVRTGATERISRRELDVATPTDDSWAPWLADGGDRLLAALRDTAAEDPLWVWGDDPHARWWARRQLHETVVHNADAALAAGEGFELPQRVAADGICELLDSVPVRLGWPGAARPQGEATLHLHATDPSGSLGDDGEWMVSLADETVTYVHGHGKGDVAVRAPVGYLMLLVNRRLPVESEMLEVFGDPDTLAASLEAVSW